MIVKLLTEHHLEFLSLKGGCRGSSESTLVKMSNCWKSHASAHLKVHMHQFAYTSKFVYMYMQINTCMSKSAHVYTVHPCEILFYKLEVF